jgi:glycosyltransferase involved in cell wall biosynthesis
VHFHGPLDDHGVTRLIEGCRALCLPGVEDFGITPVEAQAAGKPTVAFAAGGALETIEDGHTGVLFDQASVDAVLEAVRRCDALGTSPQQLANAARRFSRDAFRERLLEALCER